jgi:CheY-like chemotaxis protein
MAKILLIDDDSTVRIVMCAVLKDNGYSVVEATDAPSGFAIAVGEKPDLIMCDFIMPGVPGKSIFDELASNPQTKDIPVLVVSGMAKDKIQGYIPQRLWSNILTKPLNHALVKEYVEAALKGKRTALG